MTDITPIVNAVIALAAAVVTAFVIPWIKSNTTEKQRQQLISWAKIGVAAAEQLYKGAGRGEQKKNYVLDFLQEKGYNISVQEVNNAIEAAVQQLNAAGLIIS